MLTETFTRAKRPVLGLAFLVVLAMLIAAGSARAERPGWYSPPSIVSGEAKVGSTLAGSDGSLRCDPTCDEGQGPDPDRVGRYFQWLSCADKHGGGKAAPAGGLPDEGGPCPGAVIIRPMINIRKDTRANFFTVRPEDAGRHIQMEVIAVNYDCGHPRADGGPQECRYVESHAWSSTFGPIIQPGPPPPPPPPPVVAPTYVTLPAITGEAEDMQTLTVSNGTWNGTEPFDYEYQWLRCSRANNGCKPVEEAAESTYTLRADDIGARMTASVTVSNAAGSFTGIAPLTAKVTGAKPRPGRDALGVATLLPRHRLRVQTVSFAPAILRPGGRWLASVVVTDARGFFISDVEVTVADEAGDVTAVPALTNERGVATVRMRAARSIPLGRLVLDVTAYNPEDETLVTTKRVVVKVRR